MTTDGEPAGARTAFPLGPALFAVTLLIVLGWMTFTAMSFNVEARRVPLVVGVPTVLFLALQVGRLLVRRSDPSAEDEPQAPPAVTSVPIADLPSAAEVGAEPPPAAQVAPGMDDVPPASSRARVSGEGASPLAALGWVALLGVLVLLFGLLVTVPVFTVVFMRGYGRERWLSVLASVVGVLVVVYGFFIVILEIGVFNGLLLEWLT